MDKQTKMRRVARIVMGVVAIGVVGAFAIVRNYSGVPGSTSGAGRKAVVNESAGQEDVAGTSLKDVIKHRKTWDVGFQASFGKPAPDFTVTDIKGVEHRLSEYRGRDVLVVFWATWCPACKMEIPHLIKLRNALGEDKLAILALSNESGEHLKHFAASSGINYSLASLVGTALPLPFANVRSIPTTFFIDKNGTIKLAAVGLVSLEESRAIIQAEQDI